MAQLARMLIVYMQFRDLQKQYEVLKGDIDRSISFVVSSAHFISGSQVAELEESLLNMLV